MYKFPIILTVVLFSNTLVTCNSPVKKGMEARVLPFYTTADFTPQWINTNSSYLHSLHTIPPFQFTNQEGKSVSEKTFAGKIYVADFFFTACPGICKKLTSHLSLVQSAFLKDTLVLLLSHSVTPESDSVPQLKKYAQSFGVISNKWHLVTGNRDAIYNIARKAYFADEDMGEKKNSADFLHTENMLLIDKGRRIRGVYKGTSLKDVKDLISDIRILKAEE